MVAGLIQSENVAAVAQKNSEKQSNEDSGMESGHTSINNCKLSIILDGMLHRHKDLQYQINTQRHV